MQKLIASVAVAVAVLSIPPLNAAQSLRTDPVLVKAVVSGDTLDITTVGRVRLLGIEAPRPRRGSKVEDPLARASRERLASLVLNRWVRLERDASAAGGSRRRPAYVMREDGVFVNAALVRDGLARVSARMRVSRLAELERAEQEARALRRGLWGPIEPPGYTRPSRGVRSRRPKP